MARGASKNLAPLRISATVEASNFKFGTQLRFGTSLPKNNVLGHNWQGSGPGEQPRKIWDPYVFLQPLKPAASNLVHKLGLALAYQKTTFWTEIGGGLGQGSIQKSWDPLPIFQPLKLATEKLVHNMSSGLPCQTQALGRV